MTEHLEFVTYCGLYCGLCAARTRIPQRAAALQEAMIEALGTIYPTLITDNHRMQAVGLDRWLNEQEARAQHGVVYADTRYDVEETIREQAFGEVEKDGTA
jgi:hypothetical protein